MHYFLPQDEQTSRALSFFSTNPPHIPNPARKADHITPWSHLKQEVVIRTDPGVAVGRADYTDMGAGGDGCCRAQESRFTSKPERSATQGHINVHPVSIPRGSKQHGISWVTAMKGSQRVVHANPGPMWAPPQWAQSVGYW